MKNDCHFGFKRITSENWNAPDLPELFSALSAELVAAGVIPHGQQRRWEATRKLRNLASHPKAQSLQTPGMALGTLKTAVELLNSLFAGSAPGV